MLMPFVSFLLFHIKIIKRGKNGQEAETSIINLFFSSGQGRELQMKEDITEVVKAKEQVRRNRTIRFLRARYKYTYT